MSWVAVVGVGPYYMIVPKLNTQHITDTWRDHSSGVLANKINFFSKLNAGVTEFALKSVFYVKEAY